MVDITTADKERSQKTLGKIGWRADEKKNIKKRCRAERAIKSVIAVRCQAMTLWAKIVDILIPPKKRKKDQRGSKYNNVDG